MRDTFVRTLIELAKNDKNIVLITGDLGFGVLKPFWERFPDQFVNAGIAEQNMATVAAGMALEGKTVFVYSIGNFPTLRCIEQIRNDCAYHNANVKIVCVGGGFVYGSLGMSHHATEDIALVRALPNVTVMCPADKKEVAFATKAIASQKGTCYMRLGRGGEKNAHEGEPELLTGKAVKVCDGKRAAIFSTGAIFDEVSECVELLNKNGIFPSVYTFPTVKPLDAELVKSVAAENELLVTVEEHSIMGGFGSAVCEVLAELSCHAPVMRVGIEDTYCSLVGDQKYLRRHCGLNGEAIAERILKQLN